MYSQTWWDRDKKMDVIARYMPLHDFYLISLTNTSDQGPRTLGNGSGQNLFPILGDPHKMKVDGKNTMGSLTISTHTGSL